MLKLSQMWGDTLLRLFETGIHAFSCVDFRTYLFQHVV